MNQFNEVSRYRHFRLTFSLFVIQPTLAWYFSMISIPLILQTLCRQFRASTFASRSLGSLFLFSCFTNVTSDTTLLFEFMPQYASSRKKPLHTTTFLPASYRVSLLPEKFVGKGILCKLRYPLFHSVPYLSPPVKPNFGTGR